MGNIRWHQLLSTVGAMVPCRIFDGVGELCSSAWLVVYFLVFSMRLSVRNQIIAHDRSSSKFEQVLVAILEPCACKFCSC
jgi:hypothetical protein